MLHYVKHYLISVKKNIFFYVCPRFEWDKVVSPYASLFVYNCFNNFYTAHLVVIALSLFHIWRKNDQIFRKFLKLINKFPYC